MRAGSGNAAAAAVLQQLCESFTRFTFRWCCLCCVPQWASVCAVFAARLNSADDEGQVGLFRIVGVFTTGAMCDVSCVGCCVGHRVRVLLFSQEQGGGSLFVYMACSILHTDLPHGLVQVAGAAEELFLQVSGVVPG